VKQRSLFTRASLTSHPIARPEPRLPRQRLAARFELFRRTRLITGCPASHRAAEKDAPLRLLQPTHDTSTHSLSDSRSRTPRALQPCGPVTLCPRDPVELRLTANLQLRPCHNPRSASWAETRSLPLSDTTRYWYESLDRRLSRAVPPVRSLVSHARACRPISDALTTTAPLDPAFQLDPRWPPLGSSSATASSMTAASSKPGRLPSTGALSSATRSRLLLAQTPKTKPRNHRAPATVPALCADRLRTSCSPLGSHEDEPRTNRTAISARLPEAGAERVSPVDFCNRNSSRAQPRTNRSPVETADVTHPARAGLGGEPPGGVGAPSVSPTADSGRHHDFDPCLGLAATQELPGDTSRASASQGVVRRAARPFSLDEDTPKGVSRTAETERSCAKQDACATLAAHASRERYPSPIHPSTSCHRTAAMPAGEADFADRLPRRSSTTDQRLRRANPTPTDRMRTAKLGIYGPPYAQLAPAARRSHPLFTGTACEPKTDPIEPARAS
jgi:hypothetical protein